MYSLRLAFVPIASLLLLGCSSTAEEKPAPDNNNEVPTSNEPRPEAAVLVDPCEVVTAADLDTLLGQPYVIGTHGGASDKRQGCEIDSDGGLDFDIDIGTYRTDGDYELVLAGFQDLHPDATEVRSVDWSDESEFRVLATTTEFSTERMSVALIAMSVDTGAINGRAYVQGIARASNNPDEGRTALDIETLSSAFEGIASRTHDALVATNAQ